MSIMCCIYVPEGIVMAAGQQTYQNQNYEYH